MSIVPIKEQMTIEQLEAYNAGVKAGAEHAEPSKDTKNMFESMQKEIQQLAITTARLEESNKYIKESQEVISANVKTIGEGMKTFIDKANECYVRKEDFLGFKEESEKGFSNFLKDSKKNFASKTTEIIVYAMVGIILTTFFYKVINPVFNKETTKGEITKEEIISIFNEQIGNYIKKDEN